LAHFYIDLFGCELVPPERDFAREKVEALTGLKDAHLRGVHLRLPGYGEAGPTLEIFNYNELAEKPIRAVNRPGFGHIAFAMDDVQMACAAVLAAGGSAVGEVVTLTTSTGGRVTCCYVTDPEGNILELQSWA
jgi:catechol 2,3-dioxygenase-like lactoylglutathione lyase family enzyme